mmetsp:Transcript_22516/g.32429  ORF Transcript_22516/g.32429 Transcript_22516/m.32429 type:complete len:121 (+) Transcript_22516:420-782(+)
MVTGGSFLVRGSRCTGSLRRWRSKQQRRLKKQMRSTEQVLGCGRLKHAVFFSLGFEKRCSDPSVCSPLQAGQIQAERKKTHLLHLKSAAGDVSLTVALNMPTKCTRLKHKLQVSSLPGQL